jgi:hypothetical protein
MLIKPANAGRDPRHLLAGFGYQKFKGALGSIPGLENAEDECEKLEDEGQKSEAAAVGRGEFFEMRKCYGLPCDDGLRSARQNKTNYGLVSPAICIFRGTPKSSRNSARNCYGFIPFYRANYGRNPEKRMPTQLFSGRKKM